MVVWSLFAVGGVYMWAGVPLVAAAGVLAAVARPRPGASRETRALDGLLIASAFAIGLQLLPVPSIVRDVVAPHADQIHAATFLRAAPGWWPVAVSPGATAYAWALVGAALLVFWSARAVCASGLGRQLVRQISFAGLVAAVVAIGIVAEGDVTLIYGRWPTLDAGARPFGPFVNRNHFATWVLMACPLAIGYVAAALGTRKPPAALAAKLAAFLEWLGTATAWVATAAAVMILALIISTSRSGFIGLLASLAGGAWLARGRMTRRMGVLLIVALFAAAALVAAYVNFGPLISRVEETMAVGAGGRPHIWQETARVARDFWLTGVGLGGYQTAMHVYQQTNRAVFINQAHNQYLQLLAEGGVLLAIPAVLSVVAFVRLFRARLAQDSSSSAWLRIGAATAMLAVAVQGLWETGLRMPANGVLFAIAAAVAVHRPAMLRATRD